VVKAFLHNPKPLTTKDTKVHEGNRFWPSS
jgi:hypothetical protein